jgi:diguanylate cyclase (GGDEF)-like protein
MNIQYDVKKNVPDTIKAINNTYDINQITYYENQLACMLSSPLMFAGAIISFIHLFINTHSRTNLIINMLIFLFIGISFELLRKAKLNITVVSRILTGLFVFWFLFIYIRLYHTVGPAVWTIAVIQIIFTMSRLRKDMAVIITATTITACLYTLVNINAFEYEISLYYLIPQTFLLILLFLILSISHKINKDRYENLYKQYQMVNDQKSDITALYEELIASEDELREQNNQLLHYNQRFIEGEQRLHSLAYYDALTGLPNRTMFIEHLEQIITLCTRKSKPFYLVLFDVDSFKKLNNTLGYQAGDQYLLFVSNHIKKYLKEEDILARIDGDEFAMLIRRDIDETGIMEEIKQILDSFSKPFLYNSVKFQLTANFGLSSFPRDGGNASTMLKCADIALYESKKSLIKDI